MNNNYNFRHENDQALKIGDFMTKKTNHACLLETGYAQIEMPRTRCPDRDAQIVMPRSKCPDRDAQIEMPRSSCPDRCNGIPMKSKPIPIFYSFTHKRNKSKTNQIQPKPNTLSWENTQLKQQVKKIFQKKQNKKEFSNHFSHFSFHFPKHLSIKLWNVAKNVTHLNRCCLPRVW